MFKAASKPVTLLTMFMSIPLFLSFNIKYQWFPQGTAYALLYFWGLLSVLVVPALLLLEIILLIYIHLTSTQRGNQSRLCTGIYWALQLPSLRRSFLSPQETVRLDNPRRARPFEVRLAKS
jgi:hypothetical protein